MKSPLILMLIVVTLSAAGCGGGGGGTSTSRSSSPAKNRSSTGEVSRPSPKLSKTQFIETADAICERMNAEFAAHEAHSQSIGESARIVPHRVVVERRVLTELSRLTPPSTIAPEVQHVIALRTTLARELAELAQVAKRRDTASFHKLAASKVRVHSELLTTANAAGFKQCGRTG